MKPKGGRWKAEFGIHLTFQSLPTAGFCFGGHCLLSVLKIGLSVETAAGMVLELKRPKHIEK
jgi:hypothetical protein